MPYVGCPRCDLTVYSAARFARVDECPGCGASLRSRPGSFDGHGRLDWRLPRDPASAGAARRAVDELSHRLQPTLLADLRLLVSELVTNSVQHGPPNGASPIRLHLSISTGSVRAEVLDGGSGFIPARTGPAPDARSGWGLDLVEQLADRWGVTGPPGTRVWVELDRRRFERVDGLR